MLLNIEQIDEISLTSNLGWIGYATISIVLVYAKHDWIGFQNWQWSLQ